MHTPLTHCISTNSTKNINNILAPFAALMIGVISNTEASAYDNDNNNKNNGFSNNGSQLYPFYDPNHPLSPLNPNHPIHHPELFNNQSITNIDLERQKNNHMLIFFGGVTIFTVGSIIYYTIQDRRRKKNI